MHEFRPPDRPSRLRVVLAVVVVLSGLVPSLGLSAVTFGMTGVSYAIHDGRLDVRSGDIFFGTRTVLLSDIRDARAATLNGGRRVSGAALPGYCIGHFRYADLGAVWQATDCGRRAVIVSVASEDEPLALTPPDPDDFLARLRAGTESFIVLPPPDKGPLFIVAALLMPAVVVVAGMSSALMLLGPSRMRYFVGQGTLEVRTLYGRKRFSLAGVTARAYTPARLWRIAGSGMPGYFTGVFREAGRSTRVYATDLKHAVLVEGAVRVIVSPRDREGFLAALRAEGASLVEER